MRDGAGRRIQLGDIVTYSGGWKPAFGRVVKITASRVHVNMYYRYTWTNRTSGVTTLNHGYYKGYVSPGRLLVLDGIDDNVQILGKLAEHVTYYGHSSEVI